MLHRVLLLQRRIPASCLYIHPSVPLFHCHTSGLIFSLLFFSSLIINTTKHDNQIGFTTVFQLNFLDSFMLTFLCFSFLRKKKKNLIPRFSFIFLPSFPPSTEWKQEVLVEIAGVGFDGSSILAAFACKVAHFTTVVTLGVSLIATTISSSTTTSSTTTELLAVLAPGRTVTSLVALPVTAEIYKKWRTWLTNTLQTIKCHISKYQSHTTKKLNSWSLIQSEWRRCARSWPLWPLTYLLQSLIRSSSYTRYTPSPILRFIPHMLLEISQCF